MDTEYSMDRLRVAKLTGGANYRSWSIQVKRALKANGLWSIVDPERNPPADPMDQDEDSGASKAESTPELSKKKVAANLAEADAAAEKEAKASISIMNLCAQGPLNGILDYEFAYEQWAHLKAMYEPAGAQQLGEKLRAFSAYTPTSDTASIESIATDLTMLQNQIGDISPIQRPTDEAKAAALVNIVKAKGPRYDTVASQLEIAEVEGYDKTLSVLMNFERRILASKTQKETVFQATATRSRPGDRTAAKGKPDTHPTLRQQKKKGRFTGNCFYCDKPGHIKSDCMSRKRDEGSGAGEKWGQSSTGPLAAPGGGKGFSPPRESARIVDVAWNTAAASDGVLAVNRAVVQSGKPQALSWIIDSGCTRHMTYAREAFTEYHTLDRPLPVSTASGAVIDAVGEGSVTIRTVYDGLIRIVQLNEVLHVPSLAGSLLSVGQLQEKDILAHAVKGTQMILKYEDHIVGVAEKIGRSFVLTGPSEEAVSANRVEVMIPKDAAL